MPLAAGVLEEACGIDPAGAGTVEGGLGILIRIEEDTGGDIETCILDRIHIPDDVLGHILVKQYVGIIGVRPVDGHRGVGLELLGILVLADLDVGVELADAHIGELVKVEHDHLVRELDDVDLTVEVAALDRRIREELVCIHVERCAVREGRGINDGLVAADNDRGHIGIMREQCRRSSLARLDHRIDGLIRDGVGISGVHRDPAAVLDKTLCIRQRCIIRIDVHLDRAAGLVDVELTVVAVGFCRIVLENGRFIGIVDIDHVGHIDLAAGLAVKVLVAVVAVLLKVVDGKIGLRMVLLGPLVGYDAKVDAVAEQSAVGVIILCRIRHKGEAVLHIRKAHGRADLEL